MKDKILAHLNNPAHLEQLYRADKLSFKQEFNTLYPELKGNTIADCWNARLNYENVGINQGTKQELLLVVIASLLAGVIAKLPSMLGIDEEFFYSRNIGFIIFPALTAYFAWKNKLPAGTITLIAGATLACLIYINTLPDVKQSDTLMLSCIHLLVVLWSILGFAFVGDVNSLERRGHFLSYNGDLVVMSTLMAIAGAILTGITIGLFSLIGFNIERFYFENVVVFGLPAVPIVGTYLTRTSPQLVGKVSPVIAKIFSPLVLVMLVSYLAAMVYSGKDPYNNREFLLIFNALLAGVMAIILFSVVETSKTPSSLTNTWVLFLLSLVTILVNGIALSAILFRISEWGITPNRAAVLGSNVLMLIHLLIVTVRLLKVLSRKADTAVVGTAIAFFLPIYTAWAAVVTFLFPMLFGFR